MIDVCDKEYGAMVAMIQGGGMGDVIEGTGPFDVERVRPLVKDAVGRKLSMFVGYPDITKDDLVQEGLKAALQAHPKFNPDKAKYSTYIELVVGRQCLDVWKARSRRFYRDLGGAKPGYVDSTHTDCGEEPTLAEWVENVRTLAEGNCRRYLGGYQPAQVAAMLALMKKERVDAEGLVGLLEENGAVRKALGIARTPTVEWVKGVATRGLRVWFG